MQARVRKVPLGGFVTALLAGAVVSTPVASAMGPGNYSFNIEGRFDFHTWIWGTAPCDPPRPITSECLRISATAQPIAKAYAWYGTARIVDGRWTMTVDVPDGLRCGNVYYGPVIPTHDVYSWDPATLTGTLSSTSDVGCDNAPGGTITYPFTLVRL